MNMEMKEKQINFIEESAQLQSTVQQRKKAYMSPELRSLGKLSTVTLGGSTGSGDSGPAGFNLPGGPSSTPPPPPN